VHCWRSARAGPGQRAATRVSHCSAAPSHRIFALRCAIVWCDAWSSDPAPGNKRRPAACSSRSMTPPWRGDLALPVRVAAAGICLAPFSPSESHPSPRPSCSRVARLHRWGLVGLSYVGPARLVGARVDQTLCLVAAPCDTTDRPDCPAGRLGPKVAGPAAHSLVSVMAGSRTGGWWAPPAGCWTAPPAELRGPACLTRTAADRGCARWGTPNAARTTAACGMSGHKCSPPRGPPGAKPATNAAPAAALPSSTRAAAAAKPRSRPAAAASIVAVPAAALPAAKPASAC
jgi:hypothetical protein